MSTITFPFYNTWPAVVRQGWQCPVCSAVYSPDCMQCWNCRGQTVRFVAGMGTLACHKCGKPVTGFSSDPGICNCSNVAAPESHEGGGKFDAARAALSPSPEPTSHICTDYGGSPAHPGTYASRAEPIPREPTAERLAELEGDATPFAAAPRHAAPEPSAHPQSPFIGCAEPAPYDRMMERANAHQCALEGCAEPAPRETGDNANLNTVKSLSSALRGVALRLFADYGPCWCPGPKFGPYQAHVTACLAARRALQGDGQHSRW